MSYSSAKLEKAKKLFDFVIQGNEKVEDLNLLRGELKASVDALSSAEVVELGAYVFPKLLSDRDDNIVEALIYKLKIQNE